MKMKSKGKIHTSLASHSPQRVSLFVLTLLPATILGLITILSSQDKEVLAYMLTRALNSPNFESRKKKNHNKLVNHKHPSFDCDCFKCYTSYWSKWDKSENKEIIDQAIEEFEVSLSNKEKQNNDKKEKRWKSTRVASKKEEFFLEISDVDSPRKGGLDVTGANVVAPPAPARRGLARKVLPDVIGILGTRLFSMWIPA